MSPERRCSSSPAVTRKTGWRHTCASKSTSSRLRSSGTAPPATSAKRAAGYFDAVVEAITGGRELYARPRGVGRGGAVRRRRGARVTLLSASFSTIMRVHLEDRPGAFADLARAIADAGGSLDAIDLVRVERDRKVRDVTVLAHEAGHIEAIAAATHKVPGVEVEHFSDRTFLRHLGGKIEIVSKCPLKTRDDLSIAYTPGVARVSQAIFADPESVWNLTIRRNAVAVVTDGTAVLGLGDIGPEAALPVMEVKAMLFKEFAGVDAFPICLGTKDVDKIVE